MINLFMILLALATYTENECNICAWPYYGTANQRGECVLGVGLQANLQNTCTNWCLTEMGPSTVPPVASFDPNGTCICQYAATSGGSITYKARPRKSCDKWGPSDEYINSQKKSESNPYRDVYTRVRNNQNYMGSIGYLSGTAQIGDQSGTISIDASDMRGLVNGGLETVGNNLVYAMKNHQQLLYQYIDSSQTDISNKINHLDSANAYLSAKMGGLASGVDMQANFDRLNYAINSRVGGGGGEPTDLTGVMSALSALSEQSTSNTDRILSALDSLNNGTDTSGWDLSGVEALIAEATKNTNRQTDTITAIDRRKWEKDAKAAAAIDSINARGKLTESQITQINGFGTEADALSLNGETEKEGLLAAILDFKSNISTACADGIITGMDVPVHAGDERLHTKMDFTIELNSYFNDPNHQKVFALLRIFARIAGLTGAIMVAFFSSAMLLRVGSQINQRWKI